MEPTRTKSRRGFAALSPEKRSEIARMGGLAVPPEKRSFSQDRALASKAGRLPRKFTPNQIDEIRRLGGTMLQREIAARFGTSQQYISEILSGKKRPRENILAGLAGGE